MKTTLQYFDRVDYNSIYSKLIREIEIAGNTEADIFENFYAKNNSLRYCNGSYYKFKSKDWENNYNNWLKSDDYKNKSFKLYYGNGIVD